MFGFTFLVISIISAIGTIFLYLNYLWWPYHKWIDTSVVDIEEVKVPSQIQGKFLKGVVIRAKNSDPNEKQIGVLSHHGYTGKKEKMYRFAIPLALSGCTVLGIDARGHGESKEKGLSMNDFAGIMADVPNEIDYLESLPNVDSERLMMIGHSMGAIMTLSAGYLDQRLKRLVAISGPFDILDQFTKHKTLISRNIYRKIKKNLEGPLEVWNEKISAKYIFENDTDIPDDERVFIVHCKKDNLILFEEAEKIKDMLNLPEKNVLFLEMPKKKYLMSAHNLTGQETVITAFILKVANSLKENTSQ